MSTTIRLMHLAADAATIARVGSALEELIDLDHAALVTSVDAKEMHVLEIYFEASPDEGALRAVIAETFGRDVAGDVTFEDVASRDWVATSLAGLAPVRAGRFVVHGEHDRAQVAPNAIGIEIEAALAFGTGHHGTTRGCLLALSHIAKRIAPQRRPRLRVLDVGTGTAVLAIAAAKGLRGRVLASDIDATAVRVARDNARINGARRIAFTCAAGVSARRFREDAPYDIVFANILVGPLKAMAKPLAGLVARRGRIVLSGLLHEQANMAFAAYAAQGLRLERRLRIDEWTTLVLKRA